MAKLSLPAYDRTTLSNVLGFFFCTIKADRRFPAILPVVFGVLDIMTFGFSQFWRVGLLCNLFLAMSIAAVLAGIASVVVLTLDK